MTTQEHLESLRAIAHEGPSPSGWTLLCAELDAMKDEAVQVGFDYVREHTRSWPDRLKLAQIDSPDELDPLPAWWPLIHTLELSLVRFNASDLKALANSPCLEPPRALVLKQLHHIETKLVPLLGSLRWRNLARLEFSRGWSGDTVLHILSRAPMLRQLTHLALPHHAVTAEGARELAGALRSSQLRHLDLSGNKLDLDGLRAITGAPGLAQLHTLKIGNNDEFGVAALTLLSERLPQLTHLDMSQSGLGAPGLAFLAEMPWLGQLTGLELRQSGIDDAGLRALLQSPHLQPLRHLDLGVNPLNPAPLATAEALRGLTWLGLMNIDLGEQGVAPFLDAMPALEGLDLEGASLDDDEAEAIAARAPDSLRHLDLRRNHIGPRGAEALARSERLRGLTWLNIWDNPIGRHGREALRRSEHIPRDALRF